MVKQKSARTRPSRVSTLPRQQVLEEAQAEYVTLERDEKSGTYIITR